ncbi:signal transduction histidine kinase [Bradyrhizobium sp. F1.13.4]
MFFSRISFKLVLIVGISLLGMIALAPIALSTLRAQMIADREAKTQHMVDVGYGILAHYQKLESEGKLPREQAQAGAIAEIKSLRYDKVEYFWLNDSDPQDGHASDQARTRRQGSRRDEGSVRQRAVRRLR